VRFGIVLALSLAATSLMGAPAETPTGKGPFTFHRDVEPIMQARCQGCHRPGEAAPMSFLSYDEVRPWAKAIRQAVLQKKMPPWFAEASDNRFRNDHRLSEREISTLVAWADQGAPQGDSADAPPPREFVEGWRIGTPDVVFKLPEAFEVPATGDVEYRYIWIETGFTEDKWIKAAEIRPGNRRVVHHVNVSSRVPEPGSKIPLGKFYTFDTVTARRKAGKTEQMFDSNLDSEWIGTFAPGTTPNLSAPGQARLVKAGSYLLFQIHYTSTGQPETDQSEIGLIFADKPPQERIKTVAVQNFNFTIPPGAGNHPIKARALVTYPIRINGHLPHMHLRGKSFEMRAILPDGRVKSLIRIPKYDFNWQLTYYLKEPQVIPAGTILEVNGWFDNSANNPANPDPSAEVIYGEQTWNEMLGGVMDIVVEPDFAVDSIFAMPPDTKAAASPDATVRASADAKAGKL